MTYKLFSHIALFMLPIMGVSFSVNENPTVTLEYDYVMNCDSDNFSFQPGEELVYKVFYNLNFIWIPAGEIRFNVFNGTDTYELTAYGKTYPSYEWFYKVNDVYKTTVDKNTLLPTHSVRHLKEGGYSLYEEVKYDQNGQTVHVIRGREEETATDRGKIGFEACANDIVSLLYKLRNIDRDAFVQAGSVPISFFMGMDDYDLELRYLGMEKKRIRGLGKFQALKVSPTLVEGEIFEEGDEMITWVSDDSNRIPLMIESPLSVGSAKAVLTSYKGLKHPFAKE